MAQVESRAPRAQDDEEGAVHNARTAAADHQPKPLYPRLDFTEQRYERTLLYNHCRRGQISPRHLRRMHDVDLEYLAGSAHPTMNPDEASKLIPNITRATHALQRRYALRATFAVTVVAAAIGGLAAAIAL